MSKSHFSAGHFVKIAWRNLVKNKIYSSINILGLAIGMAACFFVFQYVYFETGYDKFNKNAQNIYRVPISYSGSFANLPTTACNHPGVGPAMKADFPQVVDYVRVVPTNIFMAGSAISYRDQQGKSVSFNEEKVYFADASFFKVFSYPLLSGKPSEVLAETNTAVISQNIAAKYFRNENALGKTIYLNGSPLKVTGVFKNVPQNSHLKFEILISFISLGSDITSAYGWTWPDFYNYVLLAPGADPGKIEAGFPAFIEKYIGKVMKELNFGCSFHLQPLTDIHLRSNYGKEIEANGSEREVQFLTIIGIFIIVIAWINYINLSTARSLERAKEVGLRKVVGGVRIQLIAQFILESMVVNFLALLTAAMLAFIAIPLFRYFAADTINTGFLSAGLWTQYWFWLILTAIFFTGSVLVGSYPAFMLSSFRPVAVLKGKFNTTSKGISLRKSLVSFQFILSILLIAGTMIVYKQLSFMRNTPLGYDKDQLLVIKAPAQRDSTFAEKIDFFRNTLLKNPQVHNLALSSDIPGKTITGRNAVRKASDNRTYNFIANQVEIDENFLSTYHVGLAAGRNYLREERIDLNGLREKRPGLKGRVLVNEAVVRGLGFKSNEEALNKEIIFASGPGEVQAEIIGVVKNYHQRSLKEPFDPVLYYYPDYSNWSYFTLNVNTANLRDNISFIQNAYKQTFTGEDFQHFFLSEYFDRQYKSDKNFGNVFGLFTMLAIFVSCLGLLGLSSFMIKMRTKEIGIRKALGASVQNILLLISKDFIRLVFFASVIALPVIYFSANKWLSNYAFRIHPGWYIFVLPPLFLLIIALVTIGLQSIKAALVNPVKSLRTE
jgi:putative ABC transport system permease protein